MQLRRPHIPELQEKAKLTLVSATSIVEGGAHDVLLKDSQPDRILSISGLPRHRTLPFKPSLAYQSTPRASGAARCGTWNTRSF